MLGWGTVQVVRPWVQSPIQQQEKKKEREREREKKRKSKHVSYFD
jgi:hypothetical protein